MKHISKDDIDEMDEDSVGAAGPTTVKESLRAMGYHGGGGVESDGPEGTSPDAGISILGFTISEIVGMLVGIFIFLYILFSILDVVWRLL